MIGAVLTGLFYAIGPQLPGVSGFIRRYFCSHILEYVSTGMFFTGIGVLLQTYWRTPRERKMLTSAIAAAGTNEVLDPESEEPERSLSAWLEQVPPEHHDTQLYQRLSDAARYVRGNQSRGLEEHLRYLAELAAERLHQSFAMIRTITWAIPILGFLGTVIGITMAIANVTPEQLDSSLGEVTGGLAVAFDTTALALGMSIILVFLSFVVERSEQTVLNDVEQFGMKYVLNVFATNEEHSVSAVPEPMTLLLQDQAQAWSEQFDHLRQVWGNVLNQHATTLSGQLDQELQNTLISHRGDLEASRDRYAAALQEGTEAFGSQLETVLQGFETRVGAWQDALLTSSQQSAAQSEALHELGRTLLGLSESEERLAHLQQQLNENLQAVKVVETLEQTASSLTAAIHVLTAKTVYRPAA